jgi:hypothetical protein
MRWKIITENLRIRKWLYHRHLLIMLTILITIDIGSARLVTSVQAVCWVYLHREFPELALNIFWITALRVGGISVRYFGQNANFIFATCKYKQQLRCQQGLQMNIPTRNTRACQWTFIQKIRYLEPICNRFRGIFSSARDRVTIAT